MSPGGLDPESHLALLVGRTSQDLSPEVSARWRGGTVPLVGQQERRAYSVPWSAAQPLHRPC